jgi:hypothetical protein
VIYYLGWHNIWQKLKNFKIITMKKIMLLTLAVALFSPRMFAQSPTHTNFYKVASHQTADVNIELVDIIARMDFSKFKIKLDSKSNDILIYEPSQSSFVIGGNNCEVADKSMIIDPLGKGSRVINAKCAGTDMHVDNYTFNFDGLYKVSKDVPPLDAPNFILPPSINDFTVGDYKVEMTGIKKITAITVVDFKVTYTGSGYGLVNANRLGVKIDSGQEFANTRNNQKELMLANGESGRIVAEFKIPGKIADMQFANMEILWRDTFKESKAEKLDGHTFEIVIDPGMTAGKNK